MPNHCFDQIEHVYTQSMVLQYSILLCQIDFFPQLGILVCEIKKNV